MIKTSKLLEKFLTRRTEGFTASLLFDTLREAKGPDEMKEGFLGDGWLEGQRFLFRVSPSRAVGESFINHIYRPMWRGMDAENTSSFGLRLDLMNFKAAAKLNRKML